MAVILLIVTGGALGWLASILFRVDDTHGITANIIVGVTGAVVSGLVICPMIGGSNVLAGQYGPFALVVSVLGSAGLLALFQVARNTAIR
ncbi:transglycosylase [Croceicoccus estronivorus]|uniref:GlsB/YeaQ/YmgE family stress response membrane protein n=1 Tax=Croceicoccus estronivorus TaxID=1172626 RepID=UPI0008322095|nr:transglycosylase [Croceicoccus estronivorus]OCC24113.1 transglycosylase [Croceicoccus estronivorus]